MTDYLILGGGLAGCVLASRLKEYHPTLSITLIETGPDEHNHPLITEPMGTMQLNNSLFQYNLKSVSQKHYEAWTWGDRADYDLWGKMVDDKRWTYDGLLPYFRKTETHHDAQADPYQHGFDGPIHSTPALGRTYPLTEQLKEAYLKIGVKLISDHNGGDNKGIAPHVENWHNGKRQPAGKAYDLQDMNIPLDGSIISIGIINLLPTSRGSVTLASTNVAADPLFDPNYHATHTDRAVIRAAMRRNMSAFETSEGQAIVVEEVPPAGFPPLTSESTDQELDARVRRCGGTFYHTDGTASMGRVVDAECRVNGVAGLRVVDASVMQTPISAHFIAEQMAEIIAGKKALNQSANGRALHGK